MNYLKKTSQDGNLYTKAGLFIVILIAVVAIAGICRYCADKNAAAS